jgi:hypothetical protein
MSLLSLLTSFLSKSTLPLPQVPWAARGATLSYPCPQPWSVSLGHHIQLNTIVDYGKHFQRSLLLTSRSLWSREEATRK